MPLLGVALAGLGLILCAVARSDTDESIEVQVRGSVAEKSWAIHVNVRWAEGN